MNVKKTKSSKKIVLKIYHVHDTLEEQGKVEGFFSNAENADKVGSLVEEMQ